MRYIVILLLFALPCAPARAENIPFGPQPADLRCTMDGTHCIRLRNYIEDTCALIEIAATQAELDTGFFARLLWRESLYDPAAISPAGAQGIAQFMPGTAALRGLDDPFNPAEAIFASATYLAEMAGRFGNIGLAAAAYNGGENRMERFLANKDSILPTETLNYVSAITGHEAATWRDAPPESVDLRLDKDTPFLTACTSQAKGKSLREFRDPVPPWGVIIAAGRRDSLAAYFGKQNQEKHAALIGKFKLTVVKAVMPGFGTTKQFTAQIAMPSQKAALEMCKKMRARGAFCLVNRN
jgi:hypothetical protein